MSNVLSNVSRPWKTLAFLKTNLVWAIPAAMLLGLLFGALVQPIFLKSLILPITFTMVYPMMVNLQIKKIFSGGDYKLQFTTLFLNFGIIPFAALGIGKFFFHENALSALGMLLAATLPTSGMTISWTGFAKGNLNAAIKMSILGLLIGSLATPLYAKWLMGALVEIPLGKIFGQIATIVFLPMILGYATQRFIIWKYGEVKYRQDIKQKFPLISTLGVLSIVFTAMALKAETILSNPSELLILFAPLLLMYGITFVLGTIVGKLFFDREDAIALVYGTAPKNLSIALAIAMNAFGKQGSDIALVIALSFVIQIQSSAWYIKFIDKIFGASNRMRHAEAIPVKKPASQ